MVKHLPFLVVLIIHTIVNAQTSQRISSVCEERGIKFELSLSWQQIMAKAKAENKFIFVDAYATWCAPCKLMDKEIFPDKTVGEFFNAQFISVKVQMDKTEKDNEKVRSWYADARHINNTYKPDGYPYFLFFAPDGKLANKSTGFQKAEQFIALAKESLSNPIGQYENEIKKFKNGQLDVAGMPALAILAKKNKNENVANSIAKEYKIKYLDHLNDEGAFAKENLLFITEFYYYLLNTKDRFFEFFYRQGDKANQIMNHPFGKVSEWIVTAIIKKDEITDKLYKDGKPIIISDPKWKKISASITEKFSETYANKYFPDEQINYYKAVGNWKYYVNYVNKKIGMFPPKAGGHLFCDQFGDSWGLNVYAWDLFQHCNKKKYLKQGLYWIDWGIQLSAKESKDSLPNIQYLDTKANLLYRLGRKQKAIVLEQRAISFLAAESPLYKEYNEMIEKMKKGLPTWPVK